MTSLTKSMIYNLIQNKPTIYTHTHSLSQQSQTSYIFDSNTAKEKLNVNLILAKIQINMPLIFLSSGDECRICLGSMSCTQGWFPVGELTPHVIRDKAKQSFNIFPFRGLGL
ncbi:hypothetical protein VP01_3455g2 [Puccinia sorghi]|uniref:Uncharacterized protein n=1 Tax=Puccinia sorghi TaxID=27349 RepID=A0A0L6UW86_9BASI|nr:hypothetical protein VP01_3455g2 [Puccinia sorghi]